MPLVLVQNERTVGGLYDLWEDSTGELYHYPNQYRNLVVPGEPFVYYRGIRTADGRKRSEPQYFGAGIIKSVWRDDSVPEDAPKRTWKWYCSIDRYEEFAAPVSWKINNQTIEQIPRNLFGNGVRRIATEVYNAILRSAHSTEPDWDSLGEISNDVGEIEATSRLAVTIQRVVRDTALSRRLKRLHKDRCQICGTALQLGHGETYSEAHHLQPLGAPHNGPDVEGNILVLCPNHHILCDYAAIQLHIQDIQILRHHELRMNYIDYHNQLVVRRHPTGSPSPITI